MKIFVKTAAVCAVILGAASCSASRLEQMKMAENVKVDCTPEVLALTGDKVPAKITVTYPEGYVHPSATIEVTPVLVYEGGEVAARTYTYQGEKVKDNFKVVSKKGGSVTEAFAFDFAPGMEKAYLELRSTAYYKGRATRIPAIKVADGVNTTQNLACSKGAFSFKQDNYQNVIVDKAEGQVLYDINSASVKGSELRSQSIRELQAALEEIASDPRYTVTGTEIVAYASPDGGQKLNASLSDKRAGSAREAWGKATGGMKADNLEVKSMGQDWDGFKEAIQNSKISDKDLILRVLSMYSDPAVRESEIKNMSKVYTEISKDVFPELRRARFIANLEYQNFTDEELETLSRTAIDALDEEALLRVAANAGSAERKAELYKSAARKFGSERALFNLAVIALSEGKPAEAEARLDEIKGSDADVLNAKGVCELQRGNYDKAAGLFMQAGTDEAKANLATIDILQGHYDAAARKFDTVDGCNKAVAYILDGELDKAAAAVKGDSARADYLRAVIAARKGDKTAVKNSLESAIRKDSSLAGRAAKDIEFANYR